MSGCKPLLTVLYWNLTRATGHEMATVTVYITEVQTDNGVYWNVENPETGEELAQCDTRKEAVAVCVEMKNNGTIDRFCVNE